MIINESHVEEAAIEWFKELGYIYADGRTIAPGEPAAERETFGSVVLEGRLQAAIDRINPKIPADAREEAFQKVLRHGTPSLMQTNRAFHEVLRNGVLVEYKRADGSIAGDLVRLIDFEQPAKNNWLVVNQFTVIEGQHNRRPDIVVFINGLPLAILELKNPADEKATIWSAHTQLQTYKAQIPSLMHTNELLVISDGTEARIGSISANQEWFKIWRTIDGKTEASKGLLELEVLVKGVFEKQRLLDLLQHFIVFDEDPDSGKVQKIIAGYHQFHAVNLAVTETVRASGMIKVKQGKKGEIGDRRVGVVWHTQGSGKSFSMLFYAAQIVRNSAMQNPTLVVLTDRNDLDDQLFGQFQRCHEILGQTPVQADNREHLRELLNRGSGGVVFTTIHKFMPEDTEQMPKLSDRQNIVVVADEAHRSQYGFGGKVNTKTGKMTYGFASNLRDALPNASFIGFTGTPIDKKDANTRKVFGDYINIYDIKQAVEDKATVPIYYESRIAKLALNESVLPQIDSEFDTLTEAEEVTTKEKLKSKWAAIEALVGESKRIKLIAADLVAHFDRRLEALDGKAMIVCMSRRICVDLYNALVKLRPAWAGASDDDAEVEKNKACVVKVVMTGGADDGPDWQPHIRSKDKRRALANRFKDSKDPFKIVIVRDMWLTGFDAPCLHTMYADKPMQGHGLMQAIARVNRVFKDKQGGLVVDYLGLADQLKKALATYTDSGGKGSPSNDIQQAVDVLLEKHGVACDMFHGFDWSKWAVGKPMERLALIPAGQEHILQQEDGKNRFVKTVKAMSGAFSLCSSSDQANDIRDDAAFFQAIASALNKNNTERGQTPEQIDAAVRQLVSRAITTEGEVIDVFAAAGLKRPNIGILDDRFLVEIRGLKHKNVAAELLAKLLKDEIKISSRKNLVQSQLFSEKLKQTLNAYHNRAIATQEVIEELVKLAKEMSEASKRGKSLGLTEDEVAFYDALAANESAVKAMGNAELKVIAAELVTRVRASVTIDWTVRESARAKIKVMVKKILRKYGFPPDLTDEATQTVLAQAEMLCASWV